MRGADVGTGFAGTECDDTTAAATEDDPVAEVEDCLLSSDTVSFSQTFSVTVCSQQTLTVTNLSIMPRLISQVCRSFLQNIWKNIVDSHNCLK